MSNGPAMLRPLFLALAGTALLAAPLAAQAPNRAVQQGQGASAVLPGLSARDRQMGAEAYKEIVGEFGGSVDGALASYVRQVALKVAMASIPGSRPEDWTVTVLNSPIPNAMATPGGYIYITRGLLAMINNEAELASVLGHEVGHVAARHSDKRNSRATIGALGSIAASILLGNDAASLVNTGANAWVAGFSRAQENEADTLGMRYAASAGYDPRASASMLAALDRVGTVEGRQNYETRGLNSIFSTHPVTADRVRRVAQQAAQMRAGGLTNAGPYLSAINGMAYGDAADQGIISGQSFRHGALRLAFDAPAGFTLQNSPDAVTGAGRDGAQFLFTDVNAQPNQSLSDITRSVWQQTAGQMPEAGYRERRVNQLSAATSEARLHSSNGQVVDVGINVFRMPSGRTYLLRTVSPSGRSQQFEQMIASFRQLSPSEAAAATKGRQIEVVTVRAGDTAQTLAARMAPPYNRVESFLALNGLQNRTLSPGERLKLIAG